MVSRVGSRNSRYYSIFYLPLIQALQAKKSFCISSSNGGLGFCLGIFIARSPLDNYLKLTLLVH
jgi:hypothetical protein